MRLVLNIQDSKATAFINFIKSLDFIRIETSENTQEPTKQEILNSITKGMKEVQLHQQGKLNLQSAKDFLNEL